MFSHLINCQYKWLARVCKNPGYEKLSWWEPVYNFDTLEKEWTKSVQLWFDYLSSKTGDELSFEITFIGYDGSLWAATPRDIALQLNYHSIHHRSRYKL
ncbi:MAG: DinB family protein [Ginsengibacter sp.]